MSSAIPSLEMPVPVRDTRPRGDVIVVLRDVPWETYVALCDAPSRSASPRMAYLDGLLELMSPSKEHEYKKTLIARLVEAYAEARGLSLNGFGFGSETLRKKPRKAGVEPDECYVLGTEPKAFPDLAIEVVLSSAGVDRLEIYRRLGVREVWFFVDGRFQVLELAGHRYHRLERSALLPELDLTRLAAIVREADPFRQTETVQTFRESLRTRRRRRRR